MYNEMIMILWAVGIVVATVIMMNLSFFSFMEKMDKRPLNHLDGLRAILAIMVVFHHFFFNYFYSKTGMWVINGNYFFSFIGKFAVGIFFILSGYLFSNISINRLSWWVSFYKKRFLRIVPVTILSSLCCVLISYIYGSQSKEHLLNIIPWFDGGIFNERNPLFGMSNSNIINAGVTWSLAWEWRLYFALPLIALLIPLNKRAVTGIIVSILSFIFYIYTKIAHPELNSGVYLAIFFFSVGFFCKHFHMKLLDRLTSNTIIQSAVIILLFIIPFTGKISTAISPLFAALLFIMICNGATFFGILNIKGLKRLGVTSYSLYLIHGIFWYIGFKTILSETNIIYLSPLVFFLIILSSILISYTIEYPIYNLSKKNKIKKTE
ncbi:Acyl-transf-3 domain-containing protein [Edwardsiella anguillarum]|uniref:acyltransferase family protein n=2 Tax=Hafniaceae TaxID=1903412 RepID=UPI0008FFA877|nr:acyltransferase [Edwardsiella anguillarum]RFT01942.1 acyltransferase [Edwardsiella anguillarum]BET87043.1 Acyl-transf-3 domain-containing protein [Edwardsiella anguillarum]BET90469.1 Acyl-transf-3 domain-containing protein [Edwardsiella anguillarum]